MWSKQVESESIFLTLGIGRIIASSESLQKQKKKKKLK